MTRRAWQRMGDVLALVGLLIPVAIVGGWE